MIHTLLILSQKNNLELKFNLEKTDIQTGCLKNKVHYLNSANRAKSQSLNYFKE